MEETILLGRDRRLIPLARQQWAQHLASVPQHQASRLAFMTPAHHRVRYWVVQELPRQHTPISPEIIASELSLPLDQVVTVLEELERNLFFLVRNPEGAVTWAFPVTVEPTPHELQFSTGEQTYAA